MYDKVKIPKVKKPTPWGKGEKPRNPMGPKPKGNSQRKKKDRSSYRDGGGRY